MVRSHGLKREWIRNSFIPLQLFPEQKYEGHFSKKNIDSVSAFTFEVETLLDTRYLTPWNTHSGISKVDDGCKVPYLSGSIFNSLS